MTSIPQILLSKLAADARGHEERECQESGF